METKEITIKDQLTGIEASKAEQIEKTFAPMVTMLKEYETAYKEIISLDQEDPETAKRAKRLRLDIGKIRIAAEKNRKEQKEEYLRAGKAIDGVNNILKWAIAEKEGKLKEIETYQERKEQERKEALEAERIEILSQYEVDGTHLSLGEMADPVWENYLAGTKANYEQVKEAEKKAEEERKIQEKKARVYNERREILLPYAGYIDPATLTIDTTTEEYQEILSLAREKKAEYVLEQKRIRDENERLKKEREEREAKEKAQKEKQDYRMRKMGSLGFTFNGESFVYRDINYLWTGLLRLSNEEFENTFSRAKNRKSAHDEADRKEREERNRREDEERRKQEEEKKAREKALAEERRKREEAEQKERERQQRELEEKKAREKEERRKAAAPDREKLIDAIDYLFSLTFQTLPPGQAVCEAIDVLKKCVEEMNT